jgi:hypothetical protein
MKNMNNEINNTLILDNLQASGIKIRLMTEEENVQMAKLAKKAYHRPQYRNALKVITKLHLQEYYLKHPDCSVKDMLSEMIKGYSPSLPSDILLEMTQFILAEWKEIGNLNITMDTVNIRDFAYEV